MGEIRSALDIALEKTAHIEGDPSTAEHRELKNDGKRAANEFLEKGDPDSFMRILEGKNTEQATLIREGAIGIMLAALRLPETEADLDKTALIGKGLDAFLPASGVAALFGQVAQILKQYIGEKDRLKQALEQQFMPKLRQKQQELARRYGQTVPMELHQDPEYMAALSKNKRALEERYDAVLEEVRARIHEIAGIE